MSKSFEQDNSESKKEFGPYDVFILIITILALATMVVYYIPTSDWDTDIAFMLDTLFSLIFLYDFFRRLSKAQNRRERCFEGRS